METQATASNRLPVTDPTQIFSTEMLLKLAGHVSLAPGENPALDPPKERVGELTERLSRLMVPDDEDTPDEIIEARRLRCQTQMYLDAVTTAETMECEVRPYVHHKIGELHKNTRETINALHKARSQETFRARRRTAAEFLRTLVPPRTEMIPAISVHVTETASLQDDSAPLASLELQ